MQVRQGTSSDRARLVALGADARGLEGDNLQIDILEEDGTAVAAIVSRRLTGSLWHLDQVLVQPNDWKAIHQVGVAALERAIADGFTHGMMEVRDRSIMLRLARDLRVHAAPAGVDVTTGQPVAWHITGDLRSALDNARKVSWS